MAESLRKLRNWLVWVSFNGGLTVVLIVMLMFRTYQPHATSRNNSGEIILWRFVLSRSNSHVIQVHGDIGDQQTV
ncbi:MAG: hypothetical protein P8179_12480 [Candidatus Thiodiazotropha sp.]